MHERIKELIEQATTIEYGGDRGFDQVNPQATFDKEKFAELIVKECARVGEKAVHNDNEFRCMYDILTEHFGVEE